MALRWWNVSVLIAAVMFSAVAAMTEVEQAQVAEILSEVTALIREQNNITAVFQDPSADVIKTSLLENDIRLTVPQATRILANLRAEMGLGQSPNVRRISSDTSTKWAYTIPYAFDGTHPDSTKDLIRQGVAMWQSSTCLNFKEYSSPSAIGAQPGITFTLDSGCWSYVGRIMSDGPQQVSIGSGCESIGIIGHEIGHALGMWHEQMLPSRDDYVTINFNNVVSGYEGAFAKVSSADDVAYGTSYDVSSVMHYDSLGFSKDYWGKKRVIVPKNIYQLPAIGQRYTLSFSDVKRVNMHYNCIARSCSGVSLSQPCQNGGYQDPRNCAICRCPLGLGGDFCQTTAPSVGSPSCGGTITVPACSTTSITSPGYPNSYQAGAFCSWKVQSSGGAGLVFAFEKQPDMPADHADTCLDFVEINTNMNKLDAAGSRFCSGGKSAGRVAIADGGQALVIFSALKSGFGSDQGRGFKLNIYATCSGTTASGLTKKCLITSTGYDYTGTVGSSDAGACSAWAGQSSLGDLSFPDNTMLAAGAKCRNPDSRSFPWCYVRGSYSSAGYCKSIPACPTGSSGSTTTAPTTTTRSPFTTVSTRSTATTTTTTRATTTSRNCANTLWSQCGGANFNGQTCCPAGSSCQRQSEWYSQCLSTRNSDAEKSSNAKVQSDCLQSHAGHEYTGKVAVTAAGIACQRWDTQFPHKHNYTAEMFPDGALEVAANYCRNPNPKYHGGVWCLTSNPYIRWQRCHVPVCERPKRRYNPLKVLMERFDMDELDDGLYDEYDFHF